MNSIQIRKATLEDLRIIQEIARETIDKSYRPFLGDNLIDWFLSSGGSDEELENQIDNCDVLILDTSIAAFTIYFDDLIHLIMVDVALHRNGLGSKLLTHSETQLYNHGNSVIHVETFGGNQQAVNFFKKNNWSVVRRDEDKENGFVRIFFEKNASELGNN
ncbi:MAG: GNAT superfamily N-acetyltransferase [Desulforhopalus sp.]|jgi:GNAT superfamily N-acetyltransferase